MKRILTLILMLVIFFAYTPATRASFKDYSLTSEYDPPFDDWVHAPGSEYLCGGYYREAPTPPLTCQLGEKPPTIITSQRGEFKEEGVSTLQGKVHLIQGTRQMFADKALIYRNSKTGKMEYIIAEGCVKLFSPGYRLTGTHAEVDILQDKNYIENAHYRLYERHARGTACSISTFGKERMLLKGATYTTCAPCQNTWTLKTSNLDLNSCTGRGRARHARMYIKDVPVFYFPYVDFPIDDRRQTGFLFPSYGVSDNSGFELATPFYWNIAPNYDATFTPRLYSKRGLNLEGEFRYLWDCSHGDIQGAILPRDQRYKHFKAEKLAYHPMLPNNDPRVAALRKNGDSRRLLIAKHNTVFNSNLSAHIDYQTVGDDNYFIDLGNNLDVANVNQLLQQGTINYHDRYSNALFNLQRYQTLHPFYGPIATPPYERLPQIAFSTANPDLPCNLFVSATSEFTRFANIPNPFTGQGVTTGDRMYLRPGVMLPMIGPGWYLKPRIQYDLLTYSLNLGFQDTLQHKSTHPSRTLPIIDIDSGLIFERDLYICHEPYTQTLEPRAYYLYVPYQNQNNLPVFDTSNTGFDYNILYRFNRFNGIDRLGDTNQITLGLTSRFLNGVTGKERLNLTIGEIFYFKERRVTLLNPTFQPYVLQQEMPDYNKGRSPLVGLVRYRFECEITANALIEYDTYHHRTNKRAAWFQFKPDYWNVFNVGYQYLLRDPTQIDFISGQPVTLEQTDVSFAWKLTNNWRFLGRWHYDLKATRANNILGGIEYHGCCTALRLLFTRYRQPTPVDQLNIPTPVPNKKYMDAIYLQFVFKGLGGVGHSKLSGTLDKSIPGYNWRETDF